MHTNVWPDHPFSTMQVVSEEDSVLPQYHYLSTCSAVVSALDCWSMVMGWNPISFRILQPWPASAVLVLTRAESSMGSVVRLGPHSSASSTLQIIHPWGCCYNYLTNTAGAAVQLMSSFCWCSNSSKFVTNNSNKTRRVIYSRQQSLHQHK